MAVPLRALLVEDSEDDALLLVRELQRAGYDVAYERVDTAAAVETALDQTWDIVISDHTMPSFTGSDALVIVRRRSPDVPFIFVSGSIGEDVAVSAMRAGAQDYVMKGNIRRLIPAVARELRDSEGRRRERMAEEQLRATNELLRSVFAASPLAIIATDEAGIVKLWNPAAEHLFGWTAAEVMGQQNPAVPSDEQELRQHMRERALRGEVIANVDVKRRRKDGSIVAVSLSIAPTYDSSGHADGVTTVHQDLTDRKQLEAQFLQAQKMEAVGQLAGGVAHDFNNLLTVIASYSDLLLADTVPGDARSMDLGEIRKAVDTATGLTRQLLAFSRQQVIQPKVIELNVVVERATKMLKRLIGSNIELTTRLDADAGLVNVDAGQLEQIIMNLAVNARDAMPKGGTLLVETRRSEGPADIGGTIAPGAAYGLIAVSDSGTGMDESTQARMFEPFFTTKAPDKGTGLGLATVYGIVKQYDGTIRVRSAPGEGTTFKVYLPSAVKSREMPTEQRADSGPRATATILVVEDEAAIRAIARRILDQGGYSVLEAPDGQTALRIADSNTAEIHLLLTDVVMPGIGGKDLAELWVARRPQTKVLFMSGYTQHAEELSGILKARHGYIAKPFSPDGLLQAVRDALE